MRRIVADRTIWFPADSQYAKPAMVMSLRDYRLLLRVARAADSWRNEANNEPCINYALMDAVDALNKPRKP